jgi:hypothetical protein
MSKHLFGIALMCIGLAMMFGGIAVSAKCRHEGMLCCISVVGIGLICR